MGFAIIDSTRHNIWALFIHPDFEKRGLGKKLQTIMMNWHFTNYTQQAWLTTGPGTRAETFYALTGWKKVRVVANGEIKFVMSADDWIQINKG